MKFLLLSPFTNASGSAIRFWNIALELQRNGHSVLYVDRKAAISSQLFHSDSIKYYSCPSTGILFLDIIISLIFNTAILFNNLDCHFFYALKPAPNNCIPALLAKVLGKKVLIDVDDLDYAYFSGLKRNIFKVLFDFFVKQFPLVTFHTPQLKTYLSGKIKIPEHHLYYLAQGVSQDFLDVKIDQITPVPKSLIYVATLGITSDFSDLIPGLAALCKIHPDMSMDVVGDGCRRKEFEEMVLTSGIENQIRFVGKIDHNSLPQFIAKHQIGINYMRPLEVNRCRAILKIREYLACGLNVVCNDVGDVELFKENIYIEADIESMFSRVDNLLSSPFEKNFSGRKVVDEHYTWGKIMRPFLDKTVIIH